VSKHGLSDTPLVRVAGRPGALLNPLVPAAGRYV